MALVRAHLAYMCGVAMMEKDEEVVQAMKDWYKKLHKFEKFDNKLLDDFMALYDIVFDVFGYTPAE